MREGLCKKELKDRIDYHPIFGVGQEIQVVAPFKWSCVWYYFWFKG